MQNNFEVRGEMTAIFLDKQDGSRVEAVIDTADLERVSSITNKWFASEIKGRTVVSAHALGNQSTIYMSRWMLGLTDDTVLVDYIDHDTLNNRKSNLLTLTKSGNGLMRKGVNKNNSSGHLGVTWNRKLEKWLAQITHNRKNIYLGLYDNVEVAAGAVRAKREELLELEKKKAD